LSRIFFCSKKTRLSAYHCRVHIDSLNRIKLILAALTLSFSIISNAKDSTAFFSFNKMELEAINAQNLSDAIKALPFLNTYYENNSLKINYGVNSINSVAIFRDGFPLVMDQNISFDYTSIPLWNIERIEIELAEIRNIEKNNNGLIILLFTNTETNKPFEISANTSTTSLIDNHTNAMVRISNVKHNLNIGGNRSFVSALQDDSSRKDLIGARLRHDLDLSYSYNILSSVKLNLFSTNTWQTSIANGNRISGTSRVIDETTKLNNHTFYGSVVSALSKNHNLSLLGKLNKYVSYHSIMDKDLNSGEREIRTAQNNLDSLAYNQVFMQLVLDGSFANYGYKIGIDLSNTQDVHFPSIDAIKTNYSDYTIFGIFNYQYKNSFKIEAGSKLLSNSLTGSYLLPQAKLVLAPSNIIQLKASYTSSITYPLFSYSFYPYLLTSSQQNNILLEPTKLNSFNLQIDIKKNDYRIRSGLLATQQSNKPFIDHQNVLVNESKSANNMAYFGFEFYHKQSTFRPSFILHSLNPSRDTINQSFFYPELNVNVNYNIEQIGVRAILNSRLLGRFSTLRFINNNAYLHELEDQGIINFALAKNLLNKRLLFMVGVNDILNHNVVNKTNYRLNEFNKTIANTSSVIAGRGRYFFAQIKFNIK
jgi:hypothetical protein